MKILRSSLVAALTVSFALLVGSTPAFAGPPPPISNRGKEPGDPGTIQPPKRDPEGAKKYTWTLSEKKWAGVKRATKALSPAHTNVYGQIDARWIKKSFGSHKADRYAFEAGVWYRRKDWGQFTHLSSAEKRGIIAWAKTHSGPNPKRSTPASGASPIAVALLQANQPGAGTLKRAPKPCLGKTVQAVNEPDRLYWIYLNSCDTANLIDVMEGGYQVIGVVGAVMAVITQGLAAIPAAVYGGFIWAARKYIDNRRNASTLGAVIMRFSWNVKKSRYGKYYAPWRVFPQ